MLLILFTGKYYSELRQKHWINFAWLNYNCNHKAIIRICTPTSRSTAPTYCQLNASNSTANRKMNLKNKKNIWCFTLQRFAPVFPLFIIAHSNTYVLLFMYFSLLKFFCLKYKWIHWAFIPYSRPFKIRECGSGKLVIIYYKMKKFL